MPGASSADASSRSTPHRRYRSSRPTAVERTVPLSLTLLPCRFSAPIDLSAPLHPIRALHLIGRTVALRPGTCLETRAPRPDRPPSDDSEWWPNLNHGNLWSGLSVEEDRLGPHDRSGFQTTPQAARRFCNVPRWRPVESSAPPTAPWRVGRSRALATPGANATALVGSASPGPSCALLSVRSRRRQRRNSTGPIGCACRAARTSCNGLERGHEQCGVFPNRGCPTDTCAIEMTHHGSQSRIGSRLLAGTRLGLFIHANTV